MADGTKETVHLTPRLQLIANQVPAGARFADIGTDHAHLPIWLIQQGRVQKAIASDIREGPLGQAQQNAARHGCESLLSLRLGAGLDRVASEECDVVSIAGMGGETIAEILQAAPWTAAGNHLLLLQPMTMVPELRQWLWRYGFEIEQERLCREDRRRYVVLRVRGGQTSREVPLGACCVSPALVQADEAKEYLADLLQRERHVLEGMRRARVSDAERLLIQEETIATLQRSLEGLK